MSVLKNLSKESISDLVKMQEDKIYVTQEERIREECLRLCWQGLNILYGVPESMSLEEREVYEVRLRQCREGFNKLNDMLRSMSLEGRNLEAYLRDYEEALNNVDGAGSMSPEEREAHEASLKQVGEGINKVVDIHGSVSPEERKEDEVKCELVSGKPRDHFRDFFIGIFYGTLISVIMQLLLNLFLSILE